MWIVYQTVSEEAEVDKVYVEEKFCSRSTTKANNTRVFGNFKFNEERKDGLPIGCWWRTDRYLFVPSSINQAETNSP